MKRIGIIMMCACLAGCATFHSKPLTFGDALRASLQDMGKERMVVLSIQKDGTILVANRPTTLAEIETIPSVEGLPTPPAILIRAHRETRHKDVRAVMDACTKAGIWKISFKAIKKESQNQ